MPLIPLGEHDRLREPERLPSRSTHRCSCETTGGDVLGRRVPKGSRRLIVIARSVAERDVARASKVSGSNIDGRNDGAIRHS
jgi:hypothetical protein